MQDHYKAMAKLQNASLTVVIDLIRAEIEKKTGKKTTVSGFDSSFRRITVLDSSDDSTHAKIKDLLNTKEIKECHNKTQWSPFLFEVKAEHNCKIGFLFKKIVNPNLSFSEMDITGENIRIFSRNFQNPLKNSVEISIPSTPSKHYYLIKRDNPLSKDKQ